VARQDEVEPGLYDVGVARVRMRVGERILRGRELLEESPGDRDVDAGELRRPGLDHGRRVRVDVRG
jgi:hypothetical protein